MVLPFLICSQVSSADSFDPSISPTMSAVVSNSHPDSNRASEASIVILSPPVLGSKQKATKSPPSLPCLPPSNTPQSFGNQAQIDPTDLDGEAVSKHTNSDTGSEPGDAPLVLDPCLQTISAPPTDSGYEGLESSHHPDSQLTEAPAAKDIRVVSHRDPFDPPSPTWRAGTDFFTSLYPCSPSPLPPSPPTLPPAVSESFDWLHFALWRLMISLPKGSHLRMAVEDIHEEFKAFKAWFDLFRAYQTARYSLL